MQHDTTTDQPDNSPAARRIREIRRQIDDGTYETPERVAATVERVLEVLTNARDAR